MDYKKLEIAFDTLKKMKLTEKSKKRDLHDMNIFQLVKEYGMENIQMMVNNIQYQFYRSFPISQKLSYTKNFKNDYSQLSNSFEQSDIDKIQNTIAKSQLFDAPSAPITQIYAPSHPSQKAVPLAVFALFFMQKSLNLNFESINSFQTLISTVCAKPGASLSLEPEQDRIFQDFLSSIPPQENEPVKILQKKLLFSSYLNYFFNLLSQESSFFPQRIAKEFFINLFGKNHESVSPKYQQGKGYNEALVLGQLLSKIYPKLHKRVNCDLFNQTVQSEQGSDTVHAVNDMLKEFLEQDFSTVCNFPASKEKEAKLPELLHFSTLLFQGSSVNQAYRIASGASSGLVEADYFVFSKLPILSLQFDNIALSDFSSISDTLAEKPWASGLSFAVIIQGENTPAQLLYIEDGKVISKLAFSQNLQTSSQFYQVSIMVSDKKIEKNYCLLREVIENEEGGTLLKESICNSEELSDCPCAGNNSSPEPNPENIFDNLRQIIDIPDNPDTAPLASGLAPKLPQINPSANPQATQQQQHENLVGMLFNLLENFVPIDKNLKTLAQVYAEPYLKNFIAPQYLENMRPFVPLLVSSFKLIKSKEVNIPAILSQLPIDPQHQPLITKVTQVSNIIPSLLQIKSHLFNSGSNLNDKLLSFSKVIQTINLEKVCSMFNITWVSQYHLEKIEGYKNKICQVIEDTQNPQLQTKIAGVLDAVFKQEYLKAVEHGIALKHFLANQPANPDLIASKKKTSLNDQLINSKHLALHSTKEYIIPTDVLKNPCFQQNSVGASIKDFFETTMDFMEITDNVDNFFNLDINIQNIIDNINNGTSPNKTAIIRSIKILYGVLNTAIIAATTGVIFKNMFVNANPYNLNPVLKDMMIDRLIEGDVVIQLGPGNAKPQVFAKFVTIASFLFVKNFTTEKTFHTKLNIQKIKEQVLQNSIKSTLNYLINTNAIQLIDQITNQQNPLLNQYKLIVLDKITQFQLYQTINQQYQVQQILQPLKTIFYEAINKPLEMLLSQNFVQQLFAGLNTQLENLLT